MRHQGRGEERPKISHQPRAADSFPVERYFRAAPRVRGQQHDEKGRTEQLGENAHIIDLGEYPDADRIDERRERDQNTAQEDGIFRCIGFVGCVANELKPGRDLRKRDLQAPAQRR